MGYGMAWWRYKNINEQDHIAVCEAIFTNKKSTFLADLPTTQIKQEITAKMPSDWKLIDDRQHESTWEGPLGSVQISWSDQCIIASMYGNFVDGAITMDEVLTKLNIPRYDPQTGEREGTD